MEEGSPKGLGQTRQSGASQPQPHRRVQEMKFSSSTLEVFSSSSIHDDLVMGKVWPASSTSIDQLLALPRAYPHKHPLQPLQVN